eukprot:SAG11_NODE_7391_length_1150_cov_7.122740_2_plen_91_part_00
MAALGASKALHVCLLCFVGGAATAAAAPADPWQRAEALVAKMTQDEKMQLIQGNKQAVDPEVGVWKQRHLPGQLSAFLRRIPGKARAGLG